MLQTYSVQAYVRQVSNIVNLKVTGMILNGLCISPAPCKLFVFKTSEMTFLKTLFWNFKISWMAFQGSGKDIVGIPGGKSPYGVNYPGGVFKLVITSLDTTATTNMGCQLMHSDIQHLESPFVFLGLGQSTNYIPFFFAGLNGRAGGGQWYRHKCFQQCRNFTTVYLKTLFQFVQVCFARNNNRYTSHPAVIPSTDLVVIPFRRDAASMSFNSCCKKCFLILFDSAVYNMKTCWIWKHFIWTGGFCRCCTRQCPTFPGWLSLAASLW